MLFEIVFDPSMVKIPCIKPRLAGSELVIPFVILAMWFPEMVTVPVPIFSIPTAA